MRVRWGNGEIGGRGGADGEVERKRPGADREKVS